MNVCSLSDDRTARARIHDEALRLFGNRGPDAVTVRDIAAAAGVAPSLVVRQYGSKEGLCEAVDDHAVWIFEVMLNQISQPGDAGNPFEAGALPTLAEVVSRFLPPDSRSPPISGACC